MYHKMPFGVYLTETFFLLTDVCELGYHPCHANATCQITTPDDQPSCTCLPGFAGDGIECQPNSCECPLDHMVCVVSGGSPQCKCEEGFALNNDDGCDRTGKAINTHTRIFIIIYNCIQCLRKYWTSKKK